MIPSLCWVARGVAAPEPHLLQLDSDELTHLIEKTQNNLEIVDNQDNKESDEDVEDINIEEKIDSDAPKSENKDKDADEFNMEEYDNDEDTDGQKIFGAGLSGVSYYANPEDDPYITLPNIARDDDEGIEIKPTDNLICCAKLDGDMSNIEIHLWNNEDEDFYVHHDILLDKFPLSIEWLSYDAGEQEEEVPREAGNYIALGCMSPQIELWDLDIINTSEPVAVLGERLKPSKKKPKIGKKGHSDAIMSLSWNSHSQNILASGSADNSILLWDLETTTAKECFTQHQDKVCYFVPEAPNQVIL